MTRELKSGVLCCALLAPGLSLGAGLSAVEVLQRTAQTYRTLRSYEFRVNSQTIRGGNVSVRHLREAGSETGKYRVEEEGGPLRVADGAAEWEFHPAANEYRKSPASRQAPTSKTAFEQIDQHVRTATIVREEQFVVNGRSVPVYVVRVTRDRWAVEGPADIDDPAKLFYVQYRIDKKSFAVHKVNKSSHTATQVILYSLAKWNQPVPESLFVFEPPANARPVSAFSGLTAESKPIVGSEAPDFTLSDVSGRPVKLRELLGKVLIVDFWATWCGLCRELMPSLEKMHREFANEGLVVLGLNVGEDAETVTKFAKEKGYTFRLLLGTEPDVSAKYFVAAYPTTIVIDRRGRIAFHEVGGSAVSELRSAVEAALRHP